MHNRKNPVGVKTALFKLVLGVCVIVGMATFVHADPMLADGTSSGQTADSSEKKPKHYVEVVQTTEVNIELQKRMSKEEAGEAGKPSGQEEPSVMPTNGMDDPFSKDERPLPEMTDPMEGYNRFMHDVNNKIYDIFWEPVSRTYRDWVHEDIRLAIRRLFNNAMTPVKLVSSVAQLDIEKSARVLGRVIINTTVGLGGLFDPAGDAGIKDVNEDFDQVLGHYGVPTGPYFVIPFMGPSYVRNVAGRIVDSFLSPTIILSPGFIAGTGMNMSERINATSFTVDDIKHLDDSAVDEYLSIRDFYHQYREKLLHE